MNRFDYVISGAGCAGLSLICRMILSGRFDDCTILLIDKDEKNNNDRTWCFWEKDNGFFQHLVHNQWNNISIINNQTHLTIPIAPYCYKMIRSKNLYSYAHSIIASAKNVTVVNATVEKIGSDKNGAFVLSGSHKYYGNKVFNSIPFSLQPQHGKHHLLQHFKGYFITASKPVFNPNTATLMDFRVKQFNDTRFVYTMPFDNQSALIEYTVFSQQVLNNKVYDEELKSYISDKLHVNDYTITETEYGIIPMTNSRFTFNPAQNAYNIGTAGGQTKASTGYTFQFIQKQTQQIVHDLISGKAPSSLQSSRFNFYDSVLLNILSKNKLEGNKIFTTMFQNNNPYRVLRFLDNESSFIDDLHIFKSLPIKIFAKAALQELATTSLLKINS